MRVLITGTDGYIGTVMAPLIMAEGHEVTGLDTGYYRSGWLYNPGEAAPKTLTKDIRHIEAEDLAGFDAVVHLAELSNDPIGKLDPDLTFAINHRGSVRLAELAKQAGVQRFIYMSSCSVYGIAEEAEVDETSPVNPQTPYAECKVLVERDVLPMADENFLPIFMRNATAFGASPRLRLDIVVNNLSGIAHTTRRIVMDSDGTPWRPFVHVLDISRAVARFLVAPSDEVRGQIVNIGSSGQNYQVKEIADTIGSTFPGCEVVYGDRGSDTRSYRVNFDKLDQVLPGFVCDWDVVKGAAQLKRLFDRIDMTTEMFNSPNFTRLKRLQYLIATGQLDKSFFWTAP